MISTSNPSILLFKKNFRLAQHQFTQPWHRIYICNLWLFTQILTQDQEVTFTNFFSSCNITSGKNFKTNTWFPRSDKSSWIHPLFKLKGALLLRGPSIFERRYFCSVLFLVTNMAYILKAFSHTSSIMDSSGLMNLADCLVHVLRPAWQDPDWHAKVCVWVCVCSYTWSILSTKILLLLEKWGYCWKDGTF